MVLPGEEAGGPEYAMMMLSCAGTDTWKGRGEVRKAFRKGGGGVNRKRPCLPPDA